MVKDKDYDYKPEYYVFNANFNKKGEIEKYNIFNNAIVYKYACALLDKYYKRFWRARKPTVLTVG